jgi:Mor family transcriptional regulator
MSVAEFAKKYSCGKTTIRYVINGKSYIKELEKLKI